MLELQCPQLCICGMCCSLACSYITMSPAESHRTAAMCHSSLHHYTNFYTAQRLLLSMIKKDRERINKYNKGRITGLSLCLFLLLFPYPIYSMQSVEASNAVGWTVMLFPFLLKLLMWRGDYKVMTGL